MVLREPVAAEAEPVGGLGEGEGCRDRLRARLPGAHRHEVENGKGRGGVTVLIRRGNEPRHPSYSIPAVEVWKARSGFTAVRRDDPGCALAMRVLTPTRRGEGLTRYSVEVSWPAGTASSSPPASTRQTIRTASPNSSPSSWIGCAGVVAVSTEGPRK